MQGAKQVRGLVEIDMQHSSGLQEPLGEGQRGGVGWGVTMRREA